MSNKENNDKEMDQDFNEQEFESQDIDNQEEMSVEKLHEQEVLKLSEEVKKERDNFLRLFAEFENYKKRTSRERIELFSTANKEVMTVLLPILDDFERGIQEVKKSDDDALLQGMELIFNKLKNTLNQKGLKVMEVKQGDSFDAEIHEAITQIPAPSKKLKGKIVDVIEKGYKLGETIIRFPKVVLGN